MALNNMVKLTKRCTVALQSYSMVTLKGSSEGKSTSWADVFPFNLKIQIYNYSWTVANCMAG